MTASRIRLRLLGGFAVDAEEPGGLPAAALQRRRLALLALLGVHEPLPVSRDKLAAYLWPERDERRARHRLSDSLYVLRRALGSDAIVEEGGALRTDPEVVWIDARAFARALADGRDAEAVELYRGPLLDGFHVDRAPEFEAWMEARRDRYAREHLAALERLAAGAAERGRPGEAAEWWRRRSRSDPWDSRAALAYLRALAAAGQAAKALAFGREHAEVLRAELGIEPPGELSRLLEALQAGAAAPEPVEAEDASPEGGDPAVVGPVAPGGEAAAGPLAPAPPEEKTGATSRALRLPGPLASIRRRLRDRSSVRAGAAAVAVLSAAALVSFSALRDSGMDASAELSLPEGSAVAEEALTLYRRARHYELNDHTPEGRLAALRLYERAVDRDPGFALAHARLSAASGARFWMDDPAPENLEKARLAASRALALDPDLPEGRAALGLYRYRGALDYSAAAAAFAEALESRPGDPELIFFLSMAEKRRGAWESSVRLGREAARLAGDNPIYTNQLGVSLLFVRRYPEAWSHLDRSVTLSPDAPYGYLRLAQLALLWKADVREAVEVLERGARRTGRARMAAALLSSGTSRDVVRVLAAAAPDFRDRLRAEARSPGPGEPAGRAAKRLLNLAALHEAGGDEGAARAAYDSVRALLEPALRPGARHLLPPIDRAQHAIWLGIAHAELRRPGDALRMAALADSVLPLSRDAMDGAEETLLGRAEIYARLGRVEEATDLVERLLEIPAPLSPALLRLDPVWNPLRGRPRFEALLGSAG